MFGEQNYIPSLTGLGRTERVIFSTLRDSMNFPVQNELNIFSEEMHRLLLKHDQRFDNTVGAMRILVPRGPNVGRKQVIFENESRQG